jgi:tetratricopeptide (TPR) repeat protein
VAATSDSSAEVAASAADGQGSSGPVRVRASRVGQTIRLQFPFAKPIPAAVFRRGDVVWLFFDSDQRIELGDLVDKFADRLTSAKVMRANTARYVRLKLKVPALTSAFVEASLWTVSIGDMVLEPSQPLTLTRRLAADGQPLVAVSLPNAGRVHYVRDPEIGDQLAVVTAYGPPRGLVKRQDFVEFTALPSAHGVAMRPIADDVRVAINIDELVVSRGDGLSLSAGAVRQYAPGRREAGNGSRAGYINFNTHYTDDPRTFYALLHQNERAAAMAEDKDRTGSRMQLARFFLANGMASEALGVLKQSLEDDPGLDNDPAFNAARGIANTMLWRSREAMADFNVHGLSQSRDIMLWRGLAEAQLGKWRAAQLSIDEGESALADYPPAVQARFQMTGIRAALKVKDYGDAAYHLDTVEALRPTGRLANELRILRGLYYAAVGRGDDALNAFADAAAGGERRAEIEARTYRALYLSKSGEMEPKEAIDILATAAVAWRGDELELEVLGALAKLYLKEKRYRDAFQTYRNATLVNPDSQITREMYDTVSKTFVTLFLDDEADTLPPVEALSIYYDFRALTPVGRLGDEMIRNLADRLVQVDLLTQAAELLEHQVDNRLRGAARAQVAARLAMIHLMNRKPAEALRVLARTRVANLPEDIRRQRTVVEARALADTGRTELALQLIDTLQGAEAERMKADTLWAARAWQQAAEQIERVLADSWQQQGPLDDQQRYNVMRAAIAYSLADDQLGLDRLSGKFVGKMVTSPDARAFEVVTRPVDAKGDEFLGLARRIASVDTLEAFLNEFRTNLERPAEAPEAAVPPGAASQAPGDAPGDAPGEVPAAGASNAAAGASAAG